MSKNSIEKLKDFVKHYEVIEQLAQDAFQAQSDLDKELSVWYHKVEGTKPSHVSESHRLINEVKNILDKRRANKLDVMVLRTTTDSVGKHIKDLKSKINNQVSQHNKILTELKTKAAK
jgi:hypothetical protein